jgi:poly(3-hydroxybutyrate) depolymerase
MHPWFLRLLLQCLASITLLFAALGAHSAPVALPNFHIDQKETSVSGLSSGGFMAVQFSVAYSGIIKGAGIVAGGPYYCAQGDVDIATSKCSCTGFFVFASCDVAPGSTALERLFAVTDKDARAGAIDPVANLARQKIWLFSGRLDSVVPPPVMQDLAAYYRHFNAEANVHLRDDVRAEHTMPTDGYGNPCNKLGDPYLSDCKLDGAGELLKWIYGDALQAKTGTPSNGRMLEFDQSEFVDDHRPTEHGMAQTGYVYVPAACDKGMNQQCRLHIAFHGCHQNVESIGEKFVRNAGYNPWADANKLIVLYPQTKAKETNPNACWDWFNFDHDDPNYANKNGRQMRAVKAMIDRVAGVTAPPPPERLPKCFTASNTEHIQAGRAHDWFFLARANGSNQFIGMDTAVSLTTLKQTAPNFFERGSCS